MSEEKNKNMSNEEDKKVFKKIHENFKNMNCMMAEEMEIASIHGVITGDYREQMWMNFFRSIIPKKFSMSQGVLIIDSFGNVSKEVDIAVYDEQYTPYVFQYNTLKFIPIEAVAVVIECKSKSPNEKALNDWVNKIDELMPNPSGITRIVSGYSCAITNKSQLRTRPIKILATIKNCSDDAKENIENGYYNIFDFVIIKDREAGIFDVININENETLGWWAKKLNGVGNEGNLKIERLSKEKDCVIDDLPRESKDYLELNENDALKKFILNEFLEKNFEISKTLKDLKICDSDGNDVNPLLSLNLQLNQLLLLINNPMPFPHFAYAKRFREIIQNINNESHKDENK